MFSLSYYLPHFDCHGSLNLLTFLFLCILTAPRIDKEKHSKHLSISSMHILTTEISTRYIIYGNHKVSVVT